VAAYSDGSVAPTADPAAIEAIDNGVTEANVAVLTPEEIEQRKVEENEVKALWDEYTTACEFDKYARAQYAVDRRYAAGTAQLNFAVSANLIGAFIDILVSFLYARTPDVSVKTAPRIDNRGTEQEDDFAKTMELVISSLWKAPTARLKHAGRKQVRSTLTTGVGWLKVILVSQGTNLPQMKTQLNDTRDNISRLEALREKIQMAEEGQEVDYGSDEPMTPEQLDAQLLELRELETSVSSRMEAAIRKALAIDFVSAEDIQVSLDVRDVDDYVNAGWVANKIFRPTKDLCSLFPDLKPKDAKQATCYYQRRPRDFDYQPLADRVALTGLAGVDVRPEEAEQYTSEGQGIGSDEQGIPFAKVVELWNRNTGFVHTMVEGVKKWAKPPYQPDYPTTRFFPYFMISFYPVDGSRHPQSLSWRLMKLQDEYASQRSNQRLTRQRATPGTIFNSSAISVEEATKITTSVQQEFIGIKPTDPERPLRDIFAEKPVAVGDMRLYDTSPVMADMERISGVQEALQSTVQTEKTATEAEIQQSGFASRTTADRDVLEMMFTDLAQYTGELSLSGISNKDAVRIAGAKAFWPEGMLVDDLLTMVEVSIEAGTTGKPKATSDKEAWGIVLPMMKEMQVLIRQAQLTDPPLADAMTALLVETMHRMGDETDPMRFIPDMPDMPPLPAGAPGDPNAPPGADAPPGAAATDGEIAAEEAVDPAALAPPDLGPANVPPPV
jgi:hypothetical protein